MCLASIGGRPLLPPSTLSPLPFPRHCVDMNKSCVRTLTLTSGIISSPLYGPRLRPVLQLIWILHQTSFVTNK